MASTNINISEPAYQRLKKLKKPGQSFSEVILEHVFPPPCSTAAELLDSLRENPPAPADPELMRMVKQGRGRRSNRPKK
jgi:predicted CopG family antitoxin